MPDVEFETIKAEEVKFGANNFIEVARKKAKTSEGENEFVSLSRGFTTPTGEKRYKKSFSIPMNADVVKFVSEQIAIMGEGAESVQEAPASEESSESQK